MDQRRSTMLAWSLLGVTLLLASGGFVLVVLTWGAPSPTGGFGQRGVALLVGVAAAAIGALVVVRVPSNPIGWLLLLMGPLGFCLYELPILYAVYALFVRHGAVPGGEVAAWLTGWIWGPAIVGLGLMFLLFPDGRLPTRRWRAAVVALFGSWVLCGITFALTPGPIDTFREVRNPFGQSWVTIPIQAVAFLTAFVMFPVAALSLVPRYRRAGAEERAQIRWVMAAGVFVGVAYLLYVPIYIVAGQRGTDPPIVDAAETLIFLSLASVPIAIGIGILKYRLFDIDVVISKAVVVGVLAAFITAVYAGIVIGIGAVVGSTGNATLSAIAAAVVALAFQPVRRGAHRLADRLVYGERATPYEVLHEFSEKVATSYGAEDVLPRMASVLSQGTGAVRAQVWLRRGSELRPSAAWPEGAARSAPIVVVGGELPPVPGVDHWVPVRDRGELLGGLSVTKDPADAMTPTERRLVDDLALQAGMVLRNARLLEDLRASRGRLVAAQDQERRRIERNLHDGAQQELVALAIKAKLAASIVGKDEARERALLQEIVDDTSGSIETLRDLAHGIYPPLLADRGLVAALRARAAKLALPVTVRSDTDGARYPADIEATAYFCVLEALQNVAKYADASAVDVRVDGDDGSLVFVVSDDGRGFDPEVTPRGAGLQNMLDRIDSLGGTFEVSSAPGSGTVLRGRIRLAGGAP
jgi:signal transduction histidine kinase